ncbi:hypothetical protein CF111_10605 [Aeromonas sobria]|jgi:hypothetical protein|uniref:hypothetical protein n=1 Tax=Aeromonas sobria TaxID=646 RepID=UPI0011192983|nr:hypothetical protein [Aeromonas sobria]TNJ22747.1 hypothetical protein CF111_10605 [Aeromonas sobria]
MQTKSLKRRMANFSNTPHRKNEFNSNEYQKAQRFFAENGVNLSIVPDFDPVLLLEPENEFNKDYYDNLKRLGVI